MGRGVLTRQASIMALAGWTVVVAVIEQTGEPGGSWTVRDNPSSKVPLDAVRLGGTLEERMPVSALNTDEHLRGLELALLLSSELGSTAAMGSVGGRSRKNLQSWSRTEKEHDPLAVPP